MERVQLGIALPPDQRDEIVAMLLALIGPVSAATGCLKCRLFQDVLDENMLYWEEEWQTREDLYRHIASTQYRHILASLDLACAEPEVCFEHVSDRQGMELIVLVRSDREF